MNSLNLIIENKNSSKFYLYNLDGSLVQYEVSQDNKIVWDLSYLENGVYLLVTMSNGEINKQKIVKQ